MMSSMTQPPASCKTEIQKNLFEEFSQTDYYFLHTYLVRQSNDVFNDTASSILEYEVSQHQKVGVRDNGLEFESLNKLKDGCAGYQKLVTFLQKRFVAEMTHRDHVMESNVTILQSVADQLANWFKNETIILYSSHSEDGAEYVKK